MREVFGLPLFTLLNNAAADGPGQAMDCTDVNKAVIQVLGSFAADVRFEASLNGTDWFPFEGKLACGKGIVDFVSYPNAVYFDVEAVRYIRPVVRKYRGGAVTALGYFDAKGLGPYSYAHFNAATAGTQVKSGPGVLHAVNVGDAGTGMAVELRDGAAVIGVVKAAGHYPYDVAFNNGLTVVISGTPGDVTVVYK